MSIKQTLKLGSKIEWLAKNAMGIETPCLPCAQKKAMLDGAPIPQSLPIDDKEVELERCKKDDRDIVFYQKGTSWCYWHEFHAGGREHNFCSQSYERMKVRFDTACANS